MGKEHESWVGWGAHIELHGVWGVNGQESQLPTGPTRPCTVVCEMRDFFFL